MSGDNWQAGDLALCVDARSTHYIHGNGGLKRGRAYTVRGIACRYGLFLEEIADGNPLGYRKSRFIKVTPPEADEFDRETIALLTGKPIREPAR